MTNSQKDAFELWSRLVSGDALDDAEMQALREHAHTDALVRTEMSSDATLDALLRSSVNIRETEDRFVQEVLDRCASLDRDGVMVTDTSAEGDEADSLSTAASTSPSSRESLEPALRDVTSTSIASDHAWKARRAARRRRQWAATSLTAAVFAGLSLIVWTQLNPSASPVGGNSVPGVVQIPAAGQQGPTKIEIPSIDTNPKQDQEPAPSVAVASTPDRTASPSQKLEDDRQPIRDEPATMRPGATNRDIASVPNSESQRPFVTLTKIEQPVWERQSVVGERMGVETVRLFAGTVELTFDNGAVITLDGPVEFRPLSTGELELRRGRLSASVPRSAAGFSVLTPTSHVRDSGTDFEVVVNEAGESDVRVRRGELEVASATPDSSDVRQWRVLGSRFDRASFYAEPRAQGPAPVATSLRGPRGLFQGFVSMNGQTAEFTSPEAFDRVRQHVAAELARSEVNALRQWGDFVTSMQRNMQGTVQLNGREMHFGSMQDVLRLQNQVLNRASNTGNAPNDATFKGSINVNGTVITFETREEYEAARRAAFGPAATFGTQDVTAEER